MSTAATDERFDGGPMVPETVLAEQMLGDVTQHSRLTGERRLMIAVLEDGVRCFLKLAGSRDPMQRALASEAKAWITSSDRSWLYTFENVCLTLALDPGYVRNGILRKARADAAWDDPTSGRAADPAQLCAAGAG